MSRLPVPAVPGTHRCTIPRISILVALLAVATVAPRALAWGVQGHYIVSESATHAVPTEMPRFFHDAYGSLVYLGYDPDRWRGAGESLDAVNPPEHFLDYEYVADLDLPADRYRYIELLESSGTLEKYRISIATPGFLPWRIAEVCEKLTAQWRFLRNPNLAPFERRQVEQNIIQLAGILGHYAGDAANPHHTTIHYNGWVGPDPEGFPTDCSTHFRFETQFVSRVVDPDAVVKDLAPPRHIEHYFQAAMEFIRASNALVVPMYRIDRDGGFDLPDGTPEGKAFAERRLAAGASFLRDLWWSTWLNSRTTPRHE